MKKILVISYGIVCYTFFLIAFLYAVGFVGDVLVPKTIDSDNAASGVLPVIEDLLLLSLFALQHSIMARPAFKRWWMQIIPKEIERSTYVLLSSLALILMFWKWNSLPGTIWNIESVSARYFFKCLYFSGWVIVLLSTFMINHFDLFGLRQVFYYFRNMRAKNPEFRTIWFYKIVRHPLMLGFLIAFWATPVMTTGHFLFAVTTTAYILIAIKFLEEKDLKRSIGDSYVEYQDKVPMLIPFTKFK
jgi:methanethiol S-methyltransferase